MLEFKYDELCWYAFSYTCNPRECLKCNVFYRLSFRNVWILYKANLQNSSFHYPLINSTLKKISVLCLKYSITQLIVFSKVQGSGLQSVVSASSVSIYLGTCQKCKISGPILDQLHQKFWGQGPEISGDSDEPWKLRTPGLGLIFSYDERGLEKNINLPEGQTSRL